MVLSTWGRWDDAKVGAVLSEEQPKVTARALALLDSQMLHLVDATGIGTLETGGMERKTA